MCWAFSAMLLCGVQSGEPTDVNSLDALWAELGNEDAARAYRALWSFVATPKDSLAFFEKHLRPAVGPGGNRLEALLAELGSDRFAVRMKALGELEKLGDLAGPMLRDALKQDRLSLETRVRVEKLVKNLHGPIRASDTLRALRALEAIEHIGAPGSLDLLARLAQGAPGARLTVEAQETLARMKRSSR